MSPLAFLLLAAAAALGLYRTMRSRAENVRYLEEAGDDAPLLVSHLSRPLQLMAYETRALRLSLDHPIRQLGGLRGRIGADVDVRAIDQSLTNASREIGDWLGGVARLSDEDRERLVDVGANTASVRDAFGAAGFSFELGSGGSKRARVILAQLDELRRELRRIERVLQVQGNPYR